MFDTWDLPLILSQTLKDKVNSISLYQPVTRPPSPTKLNKHPKKDLYACLHRQPRYQQPRSKNKNQSHVSTLQSSPQKVGSWVPNKHGQKRSSSKEEQIGTLLQSAFFELQCYLQKYFSENNGEETLEQRRQLRQAVKRGSSLILLRKSLSKCRQNDKVFIDRAVSLLFHALSAQVYLSLSSEQAIYHLVRTQFYALKSRLFRFSCHCLSQQAMIYREQGEFDSALSCLRKGLALAIHSKDKELINGILQKIGIHFYYIGNTHIGTYYHRLAERDLTCQEEDLFKRELNLEKYQEKMELELFAVKKREKTVKQQDFNSQEECSKIEKQEIQRQTHEQTQMISKMLKDCKLRKVGNRLKGHMGNTLSLASIVTHHHPPAIPQKNSENLPIINVSHVLKSHLSKNRGMNPTSREWQYGRIIQLIGLIPE